MELWQQPLIPTNPQTGLRQCSKTRIKIRATANDDGSTVDSYYKWFSSPKQTMFTAPRGDTRESSQPTVRERRMLYSHSPFLQDDTERSHNITGGPFTAELEVIQQRARTSGPSRATPSTETGTRQRNTERV